MKKTILFVLLEQYADWEAGYIASAISMLGQGKYDIKTMSLSKNPVQSIGAFSILPDYDIKSAPNDYEALILIGGNTWRNDSTQLLEPLVRDSFQRKKVLGAICDATVFLGKIGILNDVFHTSNDLNDLKQWAAFDYTGEKKYISKQAVRDKNIITANGTASMEFAKEILIAINIADEEKILEWYNFHKLGFYTAPIPKV